jgi:predicted phosphodiesterase
VAPGPTGAYNSAALERIGQKTAAGPIACFSDVHGNLPALKAVLAACRERGVTDIFVAGDLLLGGAEPLEVWQELQRAHARCVRGPSDLALGTVDAATLRSTSVEEAERAQGFGRTQRAVGDLVRRRLVELPDRIRVPMIDGRELLVVHGSPADPFEGIDHDLDDEAVLAMIGGDPADIVVCGATHVPYQRTVQDVHVVNVGSVGQAPGGSVAHYTIISPGYAGAEIEQNFVEY